MEPLFRAQFRVEIKTVGIDYARLQFLEGRSKRVVFELGLVDHRKKARLSDDGATSGGVGDVRGQDGDRRRGKRSLPRLPSNEACQPDDERQGRKPDG